MEPAQDDHDGKHPPQNPSLFEKWNMEFSPPQSAPVTLTASDQTIYHIVYRTSIDFGGNATPYQLAADQSQHLPDDRIPPHSYPLAAVQDAFFSNVRILAMTPLARFASFMALVIASRASAKVDS
jgi:hypothetical protein